MVAVALLHLSPTTAQDDWDWSDFTVEPDPAAAATTAPPAEPIAASQAPAPASTPAPEAVTQPIAESNHGPVTTETVDTSDWGWEEPVAAPTPAAAATESDSGLAVDDWDWGAVDDTSPAPGSVSTTASTPESAPVPTSTVEQDAPDASPARTASTAAADFDAPVQSGYKLFAGTPRFEVIPSTKDSDMHPCVDCHEWAESDPTPRNLKDPHDNFQLQHGLHGKGEFWCFTCHHLEGNGGLKTQEGLKLDFDEAYILCSQCHAAEARDWSFGAHGKRIGNWRGERRILNCTACHYQHKPGLAAREPLPPPPSRVGLSRPPAPHAERARLTIWEKYQQ